MTAREEIARLLRESDAAMKGDVKGGVAKLESAYALAKHAGDDDDTAVVAESLARGWARRKRWGLSVHYARKATMLAPAQRSSWTTLAKTCELVASRVEPRGNARRRQVLYRAASTAFKKAASMTNDAEDKRWLTELAHDAAREAARS